MVLVFVFLRQSLLVFLVQVIESVWQRVNGFEQLQVGYVDACESGNKRPLLETGDNTR